MSVFTSLSAFSACSETSQFDAMTHSLGKTASIQELEKMSVFTSLSAFSACSETSQFDAMTHSLGKTASNQELEKMIVVTSLSAFSACSETPQSTHSSSSKVSNLKKIFEPSFKVSSTPSGSADTDCNQRVNSLTVALPVSLRCPPHSEEADNFDYGNPHIPKLQSTASCSKDITHCTAAASPSRIPSTCTGIPFCVTFSPISSWHCSCLLRHHFDYLYIFLFCDSFVSFEHTQSVPLPLDSFCDAFLFSEPLGPYTTDLSQSACAAVTSSCTTRDACITFAPVACDHNDHFSHS